MTVNATKLVSADELFAMGEMERCELVEGEIIHMAPAGAEHGGVAIELAARIWIFVRDHQLGKVYAAETGFIIARDPDTVRAPDVAFVRRDRVPSKARPGYFEGPPDLAVEVVSPNDSHSELLQKVEAWLRGGAVSVWTVDPATSSVTVYRAGNQVVLYRIDDTLRDEPTLPGFSLPLQSIFERA